MKRIIAFLMTVVYLAFVTGPVWTGYETGDYSFNPIQEQVTSYDKDEAAAASSSDNVLSKPLHFSKAPKHLGATAKIKVPRATAGYCAFKNGIENAYEHISFQPAAHLNVFLHATPLFIKNRVLLI